MSERDFLRCVEIEVRIHRPLYHRVALPVGLALMRLGARVMGLGAVRELGGADPSRRPLRAELARALAEWDRRYREEPDRFMSEAVRLLECTPETYGEAAAEYLLRLLDELRAGRPEPTCSPVAGVMTLDEVRRAEAVGTAIPPGDGGADSLQP